MRKLSCFLAVLAALSFSSAAYAQRGDFGGGAQAADNPVLDPNVIYRLNDPVAWGFRDTVTVKYYVVNRATDSLNRIDVKFYWVFDDLKYVTSRKGPGWQNANLNFSPQLTDTSLAFVDSGFTSTFDSTQAVIEVDFLVDCVNFTETAQAQFRFDTTSRPFDNRFFRDAADFWPGFDDAAITIDEDGWPANMGENVSCPASATLEMGDTLKVPAIYNCSFTALGGIKTAWRWTNRLKYVGVDTAGTLLQGANLTITSFGSSAHDSLYVHTSNAITTEGPDTLFFVVLVDTSVIDNVIDTVVNKWDSVFSGCTFLKQGSTTPDKDVVTIPRYTATIDIVDRSLSLSQTAPVTVQLQNNFTVGMGSYQNSHADSAAAFHVDPTGWSHAGWKNTISGDYPIGGRHYYWSQDQNDSTIAMEDDDQGKSSNSIPKSSSFQGIATYDVHGDQAGADIAKFRRIGPGQTGNKQDSKLKAYNRPLVVYSFTDTGIDSLFKLATGTITVTGGGGSCPFLSTWNGRRYVDENTILTQTEFTAEGVSVADFYRLAVAPATVDGVYRLRIEERAEEVSYIDDVRLFRFDVDPGQELNVTPDGRFFFAEKVIKPVAAVDHLGRDVLSFVGDKDRNFYVSGEPGWLVVTYEIDRNESGRVFVGHAMAAKGDPCDDEGPGGPKIAMGGPQLRDEENSPIELEMATRVDGGSWMQLAQTPPRDYTAPTFTATDLRLREGGRVEIKYTWTRRWEADQLPLVIASNQVPEGRELAPLSAIQAAVGNATELVTREDREFAVLTKGQALDLSFPIGGRTLGNKEQVFVVAATGYYVPARTSALVLPNDFALEQNYPNPFNAETRIDFAVPVATKVVLDVINVLGQQVVTLVDREIEAGQHHVVWDGRNSQGSAVASGTYFVRMKAADFEQKRAMTLLK